MIAVTHGPPRQLGVVGGYHAAFAGRDDFSRMEGEATEIPPTADRFAVVGSADGAGGVFDHGDPVLARDAQDAIELGRQAEKVDCHDRPCATRDGCFEGVGIEVEGLGRYVGKDGLRPHVLRAVRGRHPGERRHDHFVVGLQAERERGEVQRRGTGGGGDGVLDLMPFRQPPLEFLHHRPLRNPPLCRHSRTARASSSPSL